MISPDLSRKRLEILRGMLPKLSKVGVLWCGPGEPLGESEWAETQAAARVLRVQPASLPVRGTLDPTGAFASAGQQRIEALVVLDCARLHARAAQIVDLAMTGRLPALYPYSIYPEAGGLMSYGPDLRDGARRAAGYVDKILKGVRPADLPVEQPTKFELIVNLKTANALSLSVPQSVLVRADQVMQ